MGKRKPAKGMRLVVCSGRVRLGVADVEMFGTSVQWSGKMSEAATLERPAPWHNGGESVMRSKPICCVPDCNRIIEIGGGFGRCYSHYYRWKKYKSDTLPPKPTFEERLWAKIDISDGCWLWKGNIVGGGYGQVHRDRQLVMVHRLVYETLVGPIPDGLELDHLCRVPPCVNPAHLEPVTHSENVRRGMGAPGLAARKTHCLRGHPLEGENLRLIMDYHGERTWRGCRACERERAINRRGKRSPTGTTRPTRWN